MVQRNELFFYDVQLLQSVRVLRVLYIPDKFKHISPIKRLSLPLCRPLAVLSLENFWIRVVQAHAPLQLTLLHCSDSLLTTDVFKAEISWQLVNQQRFRQNIRVAPVAQRVQASV